MPGVDVRSLPIGPEEAFVLTRVDGSLNEAEIAAATGLPLERVQTSIARLHELGAVSYELGADEPPSSGHAVEEEFSGVTVSGRLDRPVVELSVESPSGLHPAAALYDPAELDEQVDLELPRKRKILDYYYRLDTANHYDILGVPPEADRKTVRDAYFRIVAIFHPDRYYGKHLGSFKTKLERVFQRLTEASDLLSREDTRTRYDAYLETVRRSKNLEEAMTDEEARLSELEAAKRLIEQEARLAERVSQAPTRTTTTLPPQSDPEARKRALARKLRGSVNPPRTSTSPEASRAAIQEHVAEDLRRRYESRLASARSNQVQKYLDVAEDAVKKNDLVSAANAFRIASNLTPDDESLKARLEEVQTSANALLAENYLEQAHYEESSRRWLDAASSYERALRGKPTAITYDRAAYCLLEGDGDLRKAGEFSRKAVSLAPKALGPRLTLARIYAKAEMRESALAEFERCAQMAPHDDTIKDWIKRVKRGEV